VVSVRWDQLPHSVCTFFSLFLNRFDQIFSDKIPELSEEQEDLLHQVKNVRTTPRDQRFPSQNQALHCWNRYNEWLLCMKQTANDNDKCQVYRQWSVSICPNDWTDNWDEAREEGRFMGIKS
jgi:cytochrome c oxidase subunit 6b